MARHVVIALDGGTSLCHCVCAAASQPPQQRVAHCILPHQLAVSICRSHWPAAGNRQPDASRQKCAKLFRDILCICPPPTPEKNDILKNERLCAVRRNIAIVLSTAAFYRYETFFQTDEAFNVNRWLCRVRLIDCRQLRQPPVTSFPVLSPIRRSVCLGWATDARS